MEASIAKARERAAIPLWAYSHQAAAEIMIAVAYLVSGDEDTALTTLENASQLPSSIFFARELQAWFMFDRLRGNPRFDALLEAE